VPARNPLFELALFALASARTTIEEAKRYGPRRLTETFEKIVNLPLQDERIPDHPLFKRFREEFASHPHLRSSPVVFTQEFKDFLDNMLVEFVDEMAREG
jgi:hypothetical protein